MMPEPLYPRHAQSPEQRELWVIIERLREERDHFRRMVDSRERDAISLASDCDAFERGIKDVLAENQLLRDALVYCRRVAMGPYVSEVFKRIDDALGVKSDG